MLALIILLCIVCPWLFPFIFLMWLSDRICFKLGKWYKNWYPKWMSFSNKTRYFLSWLIVGVAFIPWGFILGGAEAGLGLLVFIVILFIIITIIMGIVILLKKLFLKLFKGV